MATIGCVPYLNARPLLEGLENPVIELVPAQLLEKFEGGTFDAALLSSIDVLSQADASVVDGVAIASRGAVHSVILAYTGELEGLTNIQLDPSSHTSNTLLQIILSEFYGLNPEYVHISEAVPLSLPRLLIGDPAIAFRKQNDSADIKILDLGEEWYRHTGLSFVYALWILKAEFTKKKLLSVDLRSAKSLGVSRLPGIASRTTDPDFALRYFTEWISYDFHDDEKQGLAYFRELLIKHRLMQSGEYSLKFF